MMLISTCQRDCGHSFLAPVLSIAQWHFWHFLFTKQWQLNYWGLVDRICRLEPTAAWLACQSTLSARMWSSVAVVTAPSVYLTNVFLRLTGESCTHWCCCFSILDYFLVLYLHFLLYYCNTVRWAWLDWGVWMTNHPPSVLWHCWLGHQNCKNRRPYNLYCVGADVKPCWVNQWIVLVFQP